MMDIVSILPLSNSDPITLASIITITVASLLISFVFSFSTGLSNNCLTSLNYTTQWDSPLSEFHCKRDDIEHEYVERIDRKNSLRYSMC